MTVRLWDPASRQLAGELNTRGIVNNVLFSPDGHTLLASTTADTDEPGQQSISEVRRWTGLWEQDEGCAIAARYVDRAQLDPYLPAGWQTACAYAN